MNNSRKHNIGTRKERSLHAEIKKWYALPGDRFEERVDGYIIDIVRANQLIEIQTRNFSAIKFKLKRLLERHPVELVYPLAQTKWIIKTDPSGNEIISRRKSPKKGKLLHIFKELVRIAELFDFENFTFSVLLINEEEIRCADGQGSWRRKGVSIIDRRLLTVLEKVEFQQKTDFLQFIPKELARPFTNKTLAQALSCTVVESRRITYSLRKMGIVTAVGRNRNELLFEVVG